MSEKVRGELYFQYSYILTPFLHKFFIPRRNFYVKVILYVKVLFTSKHIFRPGSFSVDVFFFCIKLFLPGSSYHVEDIFTLKIFLRVKIHICAQDFFTSKDVSVWSSFYVVGSSSTSSSVFALKLLLRLCSFYVEAFFLLRRKTFKFSAFSTWSVFSTSSYVRRVFCVGALFMSMFFLATFTWISFTSETFYFKAFFE